MPKSDTNYEMLRIEIMMDWRKGQKSLPAHMSNTVPDNPAACRGSRTGIVKILGVMLQVVALPDPILEEHL